MKSQNILCPWGLRSRTYIWAIWVNKTFLQIGPHFIQNHKSNLNKPLNLEKFFDFGVWVLETAFGPLGP